MTDEELRDLIAIAVLHAYINKIGVYESYRLPAQCYKIADEMIKYRREND
jgi:hypothetical protein